VLLYVVEVAYGDRPFEVTSSENPRDIQLRTTFELWHKENALNLAAQRFPADAKYIGYLDGDVTMSRYDWALEAIHLLQHYDAVQLFSQFTDMDSQHRPVGVTNGFAYEYAKSITPGIYRDPHTVSAAEKAAFAKNAAANCNYGSHLAGMPPNSSDEIKKRVWWGATGLGWAYKKSAWQQLGGLLDICILGSADWHMAYGMAGLPSGQHQDFRGSDAYGHAIKTWQEHAASINKNIWYLDNHITHYFHGPKANRYYRDRTKILIENGFDPYRDLKRDHQGLWQLAPGKPKLRDDIRAYFRARNEDDPNLGPGDKLISS